MILNRRLLLLTLFGAFAAFLADPNLSYAKDYEGSGEVTSVDPLYGRLTIRHAAIKGFGGDGETEFFVQSSELLKNISKSDLVRFKISDKKGDARIVEIVRTGQALPKDDGLPVGQAVQGVLEAAGEAAKTVTAPIPPAHEVVSGTVGATTEATGSVLEEARPEVRKTF